jgi:hypothetical protein
MTVNKIVIVFENCEEITVPVADVVYMYASDITETTTIQNILRKDAIDTFEQRTAGYFVLRMVNKPEYGRILAYADITQVHLYDQNGGHEWFCVSWHPDDEHTNRYQTTQLREDGIVAVRVGEEREGGE